MLDKPLDLRGSSAKDEHVYPPILQTCTIGRLDERAIYRWRRRCIVSQYNREVNGIGERGGIIEDKDAARIANDSRADDAGDPHLRRTGRGERRRPGVDAGIDERRSNGLARDKAIAGKSQADLGDGAAGVPANLSRAADRPGLAANGSNQRQ
jgi:hypothetical protein